MPLNKAVNVDASTATFGSYNPSVLSGGILDLASFTASIRANYIINGGGTITYNTSGFLAWATRLIVISGGRGINGQFSTSGYFDINMPAVGTTIIGVGGAANRTVDTSGIQINIWESLYYVLPIGGVSTSVPTNFRIVQYTSNYDIPPNWVRIATRNGDDNRIFLHNGIALGLGQAYFAAYTTVRPTLETLTVGSTSTALGSGSVTHQAGVVSTAATNIASVIRGASAQTGDLTQWQNSAGTTLSKITSGGSIEINGKDIEIMNIMGAY